MTRSALRPALPIAALLALAVACGRTETTAPAVAAAAGAALDRGNDNGNPDNNGHHGDGNSGRSESKIKDARGDFIPSYTGPHNADLDVVEAEVRYDGQNFRFTSEAAGPLGITPTWLYVWGVDRGAGVARFGPIAPGVTFDMVVTVSATGAAVRDLVSGAATTLPSSAVEIEGSELSVTVPASVLTPRGRAPSQFTVNLWPRSGAGGNNVIADFAPDNSMAPVRLK